MHDDGLFHTFCDAKSLDERPHVVAVYWTDILKSKLLEKHPGRKDPDALFHPARHIRGAVWHIAQKFLYAAFKLLIQRPSHHLGEVVAKGTDGLADAHFVVV